MRSWSAEQVARASGARLHRGEREAGAGPEQAVVDSRHAGPGSLFVGLPGERTHGGRFGGEVLMAGAWGVLSDATHAEQALSTAPEGAVLSADDPLAALHRLARGWRRELAAQVIGVTGSTGKTSTKDLLLAVLSSQRRTVASRANFNTEIGVPLEILAAPAGTEVLVLEMGMRGPGQIAELAAIAEPDVGVIVSIGPVHLELLGTIEAIAAAKAELVAGLAPGATAVVPAGERLLEGHLRADLRTVSFGDGGDVRLESAHGDEVTINLFGQKVRLEVDFTQAHLRRNLLAAVAAAHAVGVIAEGAVRLQLSPGRGQRRTLAHGVTLIDDCYNANPMSMRAALDDLDAMAAPGGRRRVAVLGDMLELGPESPRFHAAVGHHASETADLLVTVGPLAAEIGSAFAWEHLHAERAEDAAQLLPGLLQPGDVVLVKGSRGVALERVCRVLESGIEGDVEVRP